MSVRNMLFFSSINVFEGVRFPWGIGNFECLCKNYNEITICIEISNIYFSLHNKDLSNKFFKDYFLKS